MKKFDYVSPEAIYVLLDAEDILTASYDEGENDLDHEHDADGLV